MILVGNPRGGAKNLAQHLMKEENDHVTVHELRGFASDSRYVFGLGIRYILLSLCVVALSDQAS